MLWMFLPYPTKIKTLGIHGCDSVDLIFLLTTPIGLQSALGWEMFGLWMESLAIWVN